MESSSCDKHLQSFESLCREVIDEFLEDHRRDGLPDNPFVNAVLAKISASSAADEFKEDELELAKQFVADLEKKKREGRTFKILERIVPFLANFGALIRVCESSMQAAPFGVGIAFTGLRLILDLATKSHEVMNAVLDAIGEISNYLDYYKMVLEGQSEPSIVSKGVRRSYKRILGFWCHSAQILSRSKTSFGISSLVRDLKKDVQEFKEGISVDASQVDQSLTALNAVAETRKRICEWIAGTMDAVLQRPRKALDDHLQCRTKGTCEWIFQTAEFKDWKSAKGNAILWYNADPATGKSVLTSSVVDHLMSQSDTKVVYFFYSFVDSSRREIYSGVRSLAFQLLARLNPIPLRLKAEYAKATDENIYYLGNDDSRLLKLVLKILLDRYPEVYIALDGLDECSDEKAHVSRALEELLTLDTTGSVKWFIASRNVSEIRYPMERLNAFEIKQRPSSISRDIQTYREAMRMCPTHDYEWFDTEEQSFLYTKLLCESLASKGYGSTKGNWEDLQKFPVGLEGTYLSALGRIAKLGPRERRLARKVFQILTLAKKLLTVGELLDALDLHVIITRDHPTKDPSQHLAAVKEVCSPLLTIEGDELCQTVRLCHKTVKDFFLDAKNKANATAGLKEFFVDDTASGELGLHCLEYLSHDRYQELPCMDELSEAAWFEEHPFLRYAAIYWYYHLWHIEPTPEVIEGVEEFLQSPAFLTCIYVQSRTVPYLFARYRKVRGRSSYLPMMGITSETSAQFALPLPRWMQECSKTCASLDRSFCQFVQDWGELIVKRPRCIRDATPISLFQPGCYLKNKSSHVRVNYISNLLGLTPGVRVIGSSFPWLKKRKRGNRLQLDLIVEKHEGPTCHAEILNILVSTKEMQILGGRSLQRPQSIGGLWMTSLVYDTAGQDFVDIWQVDPHDLSVYRSQTSKSMVDPELRKELGLDVQPKRTWTAVQVDATTQPTEERANSTTRIFRMRCDESPSKPYQGLWSFQNTRSRNVSPSQASTDSDASSSDGSSDDSSTDSDSDGGSSIDGNEEDSNNGRQDCLIIASDFGRPTWLPINTDRFRWSRLIGARHPTEDIVALSYKPGQVDIIRDGDRDSKKIRISENIPRAKGLAFSREAQFSACGDYIYLLSITFHDAGPHTESVVSIFTYTFDRHSLSVQPYPEGLFVSLNYCFSGRVEELPRPYVVTEWTVDNVVIALPPLTYSPKLIRVSLAIPTVKPDSPKQPSSEVTTLDAPIYFPKCSVSRNPHIKYWDGTARQEDSLLYLVLDASSANEPSSGIRPSCGPGQVLSIENSPALSGKKGTVISPPVVMRWKIPSKVDHINSEGEEDRQGSSTEALSWRRWDQIMDGLSDDVKAEVVAQYEQQRLRGEFIGNSFSVPIRSGLDWTRKAFLTC